MLDEALMLLSISKNNRISIFSTLMIIQENNELMVLTRRHELDHNE